MVRKITFLVLAFILIFVSIGLAAGTVTESIHKYSDGNRIMVKMTCVASSSDGTLPDTAFSTAAMNILTGNYKLYSVMTYPGGTAPTDATDLTLSMNGMDLLGAKGTNLIDATTTESTFPYSVGMGLYRFPVITNTLTQAITNQAVHSATFTIEYVFEK